MLGISAGVLFSIATLELIPEAINMANPNLLKQTTNNNKMETQVEGYDENVGVQQENEYDENKNEEHEHELEHEHQNENIRIPMIGVGIGFFILLFIDKLLTSLGGGHVHSLPKGSKNEDHHEEVNQKSIRVISDIAFVGLGIHSLFDGLVIAGAFEASLEIGSRVAIALIIHKIPDGFVLSSLLATSAYNFNYNSPNTTGNVNSFEFCGAPIRAWYWVIGVSLMTPLGAILGKLVLAGIPLLTLSFLLGFGAGSFVYISATSIIPELFQQNQRLVSLFSIAFGYGAYVLIDTTSHAH